jgi:hypothetical protein
MRVTRTFNTTCKLVRATYRGAKKDVAELLLEPLWIDDWTHPGKYKYESKGCLFSIRADAQWSARVHVDIEREFVVESRGCVKGARVGIPRKSWETNGVDSGETMNSGIKLCKKVTSSSSCGDKFLKDSVPSGHKKRTHELSNGKRKGQSPVNRPQYDQ